MDFRSDNTSACAPEIMAAVHAANVGAASAYGADDLTQRLDAVFSELFECEARVFTVTTGTAANAIALASAVPPWGGVICHEEAHVACDECGAPEFYSGGAKLLLVGGKNAKVAPAEITDVLARHNRSPHAVKPAALSISQTTERGAVYIREELAALGAAARAANLVFHVDGARFANAAAALGASPAELTWKAGVDLLSFGATKSGAMGAEAIVAFDGARAEEIVRRRKRGGHLLSKGRYAAAQLLAYLEGGLWLRLAARANGLAGRLGEAAAPFLSAPVESNQVFIRPGNEALERLRAAGALFYNWGGDNTGEARLVVSWNQAEADVGVMCALLNALR
ncbi:MAG: beta-eliminating lyase-related protein [Terricaulis sp.]